MQNPLRRPQGPAVRNNPPRFPDVENQRSHRRDHESKATVAQTHVVAMSGEFVGTTMFLFFAFSGTQIANTITPADRPSLDQLLFISLSFGFSLAVTAWVFYRISGGLFNPAVSIESALSTSLNRLTHEHR